MANSKCLFCKIAQGQDPKTTLLLQNDEFVVFRDIKSATSHHYLIVPKAHTADAKRLGADDIGLVEKLVATGNDVLKEQGGDVNDVRMGFHWPPFHSISHLHLHVISHQHEMGWISRRIFQPNSLWFVTADWLLHRLKDMRTTST